MYIDKNMTSIKSGAFFFLLEGTRSKAITEAWSGNQMKFNFACLYFCRRIMICNANRLFRNLALSTLVSLHILVSNVLKFNVLSVLSESFIFSTVSFYFEAGLNDRLFGDADIQEAVIMYFCNCLFTSKTYTKRYACRLDCIGFYFVYLPERLTNHDLKETY